MKLKKLSGLLSAVLAGAMVLSMVPAAFAAATPECDHVNQIGVDNGDGTCSYVCTVDGKVINTMEHVWDKDGTTCVRCGAKKVATDTSDCEHKNNNWIYENLGNGTHNVVCNDCHQIVSPAVPCVYTDGKCICGAEEPVHEHTSFKYENNGDGTNKVICADCGAVVTEAAACVYGDDGNGTCVCGATKPEEVGTTYTVIDATHHHVHAVYEDGTVYDADVPCVFETGTCVCGNTCPHSTFKYENNGNGTHKVICADCGAVVTEATPCVYGEDGKGTCACGAKYACDHMGNHWKYVDNGDGTHNVVCADCSAVVSANVACNYKNGVCITCGAKQPAKADDGIATKPGYGPLDPNFSVGYHPICEFFRAVFRFLFGRH